MRIETLFSMSSPHRDDFRIRGYWFGGGEKTVAIVGAMRGDEIQQQYICARIVELLARVERRGGFTGGKSVLVIPSCNPFSMNVSRRFWAMDGTDINRMFPGYDKGETTQRIAAAIFSHIDDFAYGMQMASFYMPGDFVPHIRMLKTGYEDIDGARRFGLPFVTVRTPLPFDTTLLNYNWQLWGTKAYSLYAGQTDGVSQPSARLSVNAVMRFLNKTGVIKSPVNNVGYESEFIDEDKLVNITAHSAGIFFRHRQAGDIVAQGDKLAEILDPYDCSVHEKVLAPADGIVFFAHNKPLALEHGLIFRIHTLSED